MQSPRQGPSMGEGGPVAWRLPWGAHPHKQKPFGLVGPECRQHQGADCLGQQVQATHPLNTGAIGAAEGTHRPEVEIVGDDRMTVGQGPRHQCRI